MRGERICKNNLSTVIAQQNFYFHRVKIANGLLPPSAAVPLLQGNQIHNLLKFNDLQSKSQFCNSFGTQLALPGLHF